MEQDDFFRTFLSSPQSFDVIEKTKKQIKKKKRKPVHKHLLIHSILLEKDPSKLTMRQRILQKKFQSKENEMGDIDLIRSGIDIIPFKTNNKMVFKSKYKVRIPVCSKLRLKVSHKLNEFNYENLVKVETGKLVIYNNSNGNSLRSDDEVIDKINIKNSSEVIDKTPQIVNKEDRINLRKRQVCLYKDDLNQKIYKIIEQNKKEDKNLPKNQICLYRRINIFDLFKTKQKNEISRLSLDEIDIYEANYDLNISEDEDKKCEIAHDEISDKVRMINFNNVNKTMLKKKRKLLFKTEKEKNEDCINKAAYYITVLEKIPKYTKKIDKKCIYYTDVLIKEFKKNGCVCKVVGEVKWYIKKIKEEYSAGNISI
ncbi:hypothetical protein P3W45_001568 [Vairimorpha bombi]|jgi:hypothetical protein